MQCLIHLYKIARTPYGLIIYCTTLSLYLNFYRYDAGGCSLRCEIGSTMAVICDWHPRDNAQMYIITTSLFENNLENRRSFSPVPQNFGVGKTLIWIHPSYMSIFFCEKNCCCRRRSGVFTPPFETFGNFLDHFPFYLQKMRKYPITTLDSRFIYVNKSRDLRQIWAIESDSRGGRISKSGRW